MRLRLLSLVVLCFITSGLLAQLGTSTPPTDAQLKAIAAKYLTSTVSKTVKPNGDVLLQRDMSSYLQGVKARIEHPAFETIEQGCDHKTELLDDYYNRPHPSVATLEKYFNEAAREFNVPAAILKAYAIKNSNWTQGPENMAGQHGVMALFENGIAKQMSEASALTGISIEEMKNDARQNIRAGAALLAKYQQGPKDVNNLNSWVDAVKKLSGLQQDYLQHSVAESVFDILNKGAKTITLWGEIINLNKHSVEKIADFQSSSTEIVEERGQVVDYPLAQPNFLNRNFNSRPSGYEIKYYFVHYTTGTIESAIGWFLNTGNTNSSAHYIVRNSDGKVFQLVPEYRRAWSQGTNEHNDNGIGTEHEILTANIAMWDNTVFLEGAARLAANVCDRYGIPKVRVDEAGIASYAKGIYGHSDVRPTECPNMTQERWDAYMGYVTAAPSTLAGRPQLLSISNPGNADAVAARWVARNDVNLQGYRLYYANGDNLSEWRLAADETMISAAASTATFTQAQFIQTPINGAFHFKLVTVVNDGGTLVESEPSNIYSRNVNATGQKILIVDGFDRRGISGSISLGSAGSYTSFSSTLSAKYMKALRLSDSNLQIDCVADEVIEDYQLPLSQYNLVVWYVGDEASYDTAFQQQHKHQIKEYLKAGGRMIITGSEISYVISRPASVAYDADFTNNYLRATYVHDGAANFSPATGIAGGPFAGLSMPFGIEYPEDWPDAVAATNGAVNIFQYTGSAGANRNAGVAYKGLYPSGSKPGAHIFISFTLETVSDANLKLFMDKALEYFGDPNEPIRPKANADAATVASGSTKNIYVLDNDNGYGFALEKNSIEIIVSPANGSILSSTDGIVKYKSNVGFTGTDVFHYTVKNADDLVSDTAIVTLTMVANVDECGEPTVEVDDKFPSREFRGAWISSVSNLDWPKSRTKTTAQNKADLIKILDTLQATGINAVLLQVRPESDALYQSSIEPWSHWLTNAQGVAPAEAWDPLAFAIEEAHKRGMELHAWINPFRARTGSAALAANHVAALHPEWTYVAGTATLINPGIPEARNYIVSVIEDIASRYNIDGIQFDDYFYPYAPNQITNAQDDAEYAAYNPNGLTRADWRRDNVNRLIAGVYDAIQTVNNTQNKSISFGVSPFGIWKAGMPTGISGTSSYNDIYCDPIAWMRAGKVDYIAPQLYWKITGAQDYEALSKWWNDSAAVYNVKVYPGMAYYRMSSANGDWSTDEIVNQVMINRKLDRPQIKGQIYFRAAFIENDTKGFNSIARTEVFPNIALPPSFANKDQVCPNPPINQVITGDTLYWQAPSGGAQADVKRYMVYKFANQAEFTTLGLVAEKLLAITYETYLYIGEENLGARVMPGYYVIVSVDGNNNVSEPLIIPLPIVGLNLNVKLQHSEAQVAWNTVMEMNTSTFEIQRSTDGENFTTIATQRAAGNSSSPLQYNYTDILKAEGIHYYRIVGEDIDGAKTYSNIQSVLYRNDLTKVTVSPNPFKGQLYVANLKNAVSIELIDLSGRKVQTVKLQGQTSHTLQTEALAAGVYFVRVVKEDGSVETLKAVKP